MNRRVSLLIVVALVAGLSFSSCRTIRLKLGLGYTVENPKPGTPEAAMQDVLKALTVRDSARSWTQFLRLLHSHEHQTGFINTWKKLKFRHLRKVAKYYILDPSKYSFKVKRIQEGLEGTLILYLSNPNTDVPTPCKFKRDPAHGNAWRVYSSCL
jgi:hypothetical protein